MCMHLCLYMGIYLYVLMYISPSNLESMQEYPGEKIMIIFIKQNFPGCLSDSRQVNTWHWFVFTAIAISISPSWQCLEMPLCQSSSGWLFKCLGLPRYAYKMLVGSALGIEISQEMRSHIIFLFSCSHWQLVYTNLGLQTWLHWVLEIPWAKPQTPGCSLT